MTNKVFQGPVLQQGRSFLRTPLSTSVIIASLLSSASAHAVFEFNIGDIEGTIDSQLSLGASVRTSERNVDLYHAVNTPQGDRLGRSESATTDDGNLNFDKGDVISNVFKGVHGLELKKDNLGAFARIKYWYDFELKDGKQRHGNIPNRYSAQENNSKTRLSDDGFDDLAKFSGIELMDAFVYGEFEANDMPLDLRLGRQVISWGESTFLIHGINKINPVDVSALRRPGATLKEALTPVGLAYGSLGITDSTTIEAFYQLEWQPFAIDGCGTFFSSSDIAAPGCEGVNAGSLAGRNDSQNSFDGPYYDGGGPASVAGGKDVAKRAGSDFEPSDNGQYGFATRHYANSIDAEFGAYYLNYHSRIPYFGVTLPSNGKVGTYGLYYPEDLQLFGLSAQTTIGSWAVSGEFSYQPDYPVAYNSSELLFGWLFNGQSPYTGSHINEKISSAVGSDRVIAGYDEKDLQQLQATFLNFFDQTWGASRVTFIGEVGATYTADIQDADADPDTTRYGRSITYGACGNNSQGANDDGTGKVKCDDGYVTSFAWGYALKTTANYNNVVAGINVNPAVTFKHDVSGFAGNGQFQEGRKSFAFALNADYGGIYDAGISFTSFFGGKFNDSRDKDFASITFGMSF
ncbi:DUF1302 domain-containing protein [Bacterioplanoides sp.]|uniref:DUF1302 domain-containing protein n=1 Tax=Bacterioplanoides sp. TaxID=2066072 RepID=UPI003B5B6D86